MAPPPAPAPAAPPEPGAVRADDVFRLSRHLCIRPEDGAFVVESPLSGRSMRLASPSVFRVLLALARPVRVGDLLAGVEEAHRPAVLALLRRCRDDGFLARVEGGACEEDEGSLAHWEFHDLLFHVRSRRGRNPAPAGATYHLAERLAPEPTVRPGPADGAIPLARPEPGPGGGREPSFTEVLEGRRSRYSMEPVEARALGELLFRACRVAAVARDAGGEPLALTPYPSAGSLHPLEVYVALSRCEGLERGLYRYDAWAHALVPVRGFTPDVEALLREAQMGTGSEGLPGLPPVLLVVSARLRRLSLKYQSIAYRLVLEEVGALFQTLYLVATALGLSPCAIGAGDADRFARASGTDYYRETSVGEFILGGPLPAGRP